MQTLAQVQMEVQVQVNLSAPSFLLPRFAWFKTLMLALWLIP